MSLKLPYGSYVLLNTLGQAKKHAFFYSECWFSPVFLLIFYCGISQIFSCSVAVAVVFVIDCLSNRLIMQLSNFLCGGVGVASAIFVVVVLLVMVAENI